MHVMVATQIVLLLLCYTKKTENLSGKNFLRHLMVVTRMILALFKAKVRFIPF